MNDNVLFTTLFVLAVSLAISYYLIKGAVSAAISKILKNSDESVILLRAIAAKLEAPVSEYQAAVNELKEIEDLKQKLAAGFFGRTARNNIKLRIEELENNKK